MPEQPPFRSDIASSTADTITVRGFDLTEELMGHLDFGSMCFLLLSGRQPSDAEGRLFNAVLVGLAEHGLTPSAIATRLTFTGAPEAVQGAVAAGILGAGSVFLGVVDDAARMLQSAGPDPAADSTSLRALAEEIVDRFLASGAERLPGVGHPIHRNGDPRTVRLFGLADELGVAGPHIRLMEAVGQAMTDRRGGYLPVNGAGASAAALSDLGLHWRVLRGVAVIARTGGLVGHLEEERVRPIGAGLWRWLDDVAVANSAAAHVGER
ncbi:MAG: citryl-CoA lyase [Mycobacteriales bacterium]